MTNEKQMLDEDGDPINKPKTEEQTFITNEQGTCSLHLAKDADGSLKFSAVGFDAERTAQLFDHLMIRYQEFLLGFKSDKKKKPMNYMG